MEIFHQDRIPEAIVKELEALKLPFNIYAFKAPKGTALVAAIEAGNMTPDNVDGAGDAIKKAKKLNVEEVDHIHGYTQYKLTIKKNESDRKPSAKSRRNKG